MQFGASIGTACGSFAVTNIDDMFVLITFFAEASTSRTVTPFKITLGQFIGFTVIVVISMIGFGVSFVLPSQPIGFLGLLPILLGVWKGLGVLLPHNGDEPEKSSLAGIKSIFKVSSITVMNGGDNIGVYVPLFSQAKGAEIAVYVVTFYILLGVWCLVAFVVMRQKHVLLVFQKYADWLIPLLYIGIGVYIIAKSLCYPWAIKRIDAANAAHPGEIALAISTTFLLLICMGAMLWYKLRKRAAQSSATGDVSLEEDPTGTTEFVVGDSDVAAEDAVDDSPVPTEDASKAAADDSHTPAEDAPGASHTLADDALQNVVDHSQSSP